MSGRAAMNRQDLSKPPNDAELVDRVVTDALAQVAEGKSVSLTELLLNIMPQLPAGVPQTEVIAALITREREWSGDRG